MIATNNRTSGDNVELTSVTTNADANRNQDDKNSQSGLLPNGTKNDKDTTDRLIPVLEPVSNTVDSNIPDDLNAYRNRKTLTQGLMDIALFSANANQLRYILEHGSNSQAYFYIAASLIILSLILQIAVGMLLLLSTRYSINVECQREKAYKCGNYVVIGIFLITVVNIFIAAFGGPAVFTPTSSPVTADGLQTVS